MAGGKKGAKIIEGHINDNEKELEKKKIKLKELNLQYKRRLRSCLILLPASKRKMKENEFRSNTH